LPVYQKSAEAIVPERIGEGPNIKRPRSRSGNGRIVKKAETSGWRTRLLRNMLEAERQTGSAERWPERRKETRKQKQKQKKKNKKKSVEQCY
jgi:hypothetical protein